MLLNIFLRDCESKFSYFFVVLTIFDFCNLQSAFGIARIESSTDCISWLVSVHDASAGNIKLVIEVFKLVFFCV